MEETLRVLDYVVDLRQEKKVLHKMKDIIAIVFLALLANTDEWVAMEIFAKEHEEFLGEYLELPNGIPSHDTIERVFAMVSPEFLLKFKDVWNKMLSSDEGEKIRKILAIDGKTERGNGNKNQKANHIVGAVDENGLSLSEKLADEKSNEIKAVPELLDSLNIAGHVITADAMSCQTEIVAKIKKKRADYVIALKGDQGTLHEDVKLYFSDPELLKKCDYYKTTEKARSGIERREYWQTDDVSWLPQLKQWKGLKSIVITKNTIIRDGVTTSEVRYFISSLSLGAQEVARSIRRHWTVESYHWHLDVTFREDKNRTLEKQAAFNLGILRRLALNVLKIIDLGKKPLSVRMKRFSIGTNPEKHLKTILCL
jgi:predicted transposase YbfD/YdcC